MKEKESDSISFQEVWRIAAGRSCMKDPQLVGQELNSKTSSLKKCLKYFKPRSQASEADLKKRKELSSDHQKFVLKLGEFIDLDCLQACDLVHQYSTCDFHGSKEKFEELLKDDRSHLGFLGKITEYYFTERLYLLRTIKHVLSYFEDKSHCFQQEYTEVVNKIKAELGKLVQTQYEEMFNVDPPTSKTRGSNFTSQVVTPFALQMLKEQCELLEILFLYYSRFRMSMEVLVQLAKMFNNQGFGAAHPLLEVVDPSALGPLLARMNALQQIILISSFDMEYLQRLAEADGVDQHQLSQEKARFKELNSIFVTLDETPALSPLLLAWATIRYQIMSEQGGDLTQRLGERSIEHKVWLQIAQIVDLYPFNSESPVATTTRNVFRGLLSCVTHSFHEDTLGDYGELVNITAIVLGSSKSVSEAFWSQKKAGTGLHLLLTSAAGYFPLHLAPLMRILTSLAAGKTSSYEVHSYVHQLPSVAEYLAARGTDDVESAEDGSYWRLLTLKNLAVAGGFHSIKIPMGAMGTLIDTQLGAMVQWQTPVDGWKYFHAEIMSVLEYRGQSSDLEVLGYVDKAMLIYGLVEKLLDSLQEYEESQERKSILDNLEPFITKICPLVQRLVNMTNPPQDLIGTSLRCLASWVKCDKPPEKGADLTTPTLENNANLVSVITSISRIQFLPFSDRDFLTSLASAAKLSMNFASSMSAPLYPGIFGNVLVNVERPSGRYPVTVATLDLVLTLVERTIHWEADVFEDTRDPELQLVVGAVAPSVLYFLNEVFPTFHKWRRDHETSDKIGLKCLALCHNVLRSYDPRSSKSQSDLEVSATHIGVGLWSPVQHTTLQILTHSHSADIILKLISIPVDTINSLLSAEPTSPAVIQLIETVRYGFSVLNNILRLEYNTTSFVKEGEETASGSKVEEQPASYLHTVLSSHIAGTPNLISLVAGYLYHRHSVPLSRIAVALLRHISIAAPMSLHASLGPDVAAVRDILLTRLCSRTEDLHLKIGILEFFTISVQTQPGLFELFLDLETMDKNHPEKGLKLGKYSCLTVVLDLVHADMQGTFQLPTELHAACMKLLSSLWVDRRHSALQALRSYASDSKSKASFWHSLLLPLFSDNTPKNLAQSELLETCAHIINTLALENFYTTPCGKDPALKPYMEEFAAKDRYNHWSKVLVCVCKTLPHLTHSESESRLMFVAAWKTFLLTSKMKDPTVTRKFIDDVMMALGALVSELESSSSMATALNLTSSLLLSLVHRSPKGTFVNFENTQKVFNRVIEFLKDMGRSQGTLDRCRVHFHTVALHMFGKMKKISEKDVKFTPEVSTWLRLACVNLQDLLKGNERNSSKLKQNVETSLLLIQTLQVIFVLESPDDEELSSWLQILSEESTFNLLSSTLIQLIISAHQEDEANVLRGTLASSILTMFSTVCQHRRTALAILNTGILPEFCLKISNTYSEVAPGKGKSKWICVYHLSIVFTRNMLDTLSHNFIDHALDFVGVHNDRIVECLEAVQITQNANVLHEASFTTSLLSSLSKSFIREWRFKLLPSFQSCVEKVAVLCHACVAMLLRPRLLQDALEISSRKDDRVRLATTSKQSAVVRQASVVAQKSISQDDLDSPTPKFLAAQHGLFSILGNCLAIFKNLSPDLCQISLDQTVDPEEFQPLLLIGFSSPSLDQASPPTFGTVVNASNVAWKVLSKSGSTHSILHDIATYVMDTALTVAVAQGSLLLKHPLVSHRDKQRLRRELGDELISCLRSANRHFRHSSGSGVISPQASPSAGSKGARSKQLQAGSSQTPTVSTHGRGMLDFVQMFVKEVLR